MQALFCAYYNRFTPKYRIRTNSREEIFVNFEVQCKSLHSFEEHFCGLVCALSSFQF